MVEVTLSLISHTNVGKTTLARTLLRRDVGEVLDQAHVTDKSEAYVLIEEGADRLLLWDTPGFGDTARLLKRLKQEKNPLGWFLHQVWDRTTDRPLWCGQEAVRNVREGADVVLYLVNATEDPAGAGYVGMELELLSWMERPILVLLNQVGDARPSPRRLAEWRQAVERWSAVRDVLSLDAFTRAWVQEVQLLQGIAPLLPADKRAAMERLGQAWRQRNLAVFERSTAGMGAFLARAAADHETLPASTSRSTRKAAMEALTRRLAIANDELWDGVIADHGLEGRLAAELKGHLEDFVVEGEDLFSPQKGAVIGGAVSGAVGGLMADLLSGGLSLGGGMLAGGLLGALGGAGLSKAVRLVQGDAEPRVSWSPAFLEALLTQTLLRYLAVAHFGRGRGRLTDDEHAAGWREAVEARVRASERERRAVWERGERAASSAAASELGQACSTLLRQLLQEAYPDAPAWD